MNAPRSPSGAIAPAAIASEAFCPKKNAPKKIAGKVQNQTVIMIRFKSIPSRTCAVDFVVVPGA